MTEQQARKLAKRDRYYFARKLHGKWVVWDSVSNHVVEFDRLPETEEQDNA